MSRASTSGRHLSLTEELEKLEQSITLTLQEIDSNFSRTHQIVTTKILPVIEQYSDHSKAVWEASKFWKQFFEASANVSLSGVEDREEDEDEASYTQSNDQTSNYATSQCEEEPQPAETSRPPHQAYDEEDSLLDNPDISGSTPRAPQSRSKDDFADYPLAYGTLKSEMKVTEQGSQDETETLPTTPGPQRIPDMSMTPKSSPRAVPSNILSAQFGDENRLLHRVLDRNYRVQATPLTSRSKADQLPAIKSAWRDQDSPMSSSPETAPELRAEIFSSPIRQQFQRNIPCTPGVSVQPSARQKKSSEMVRLRSANKVKDEITWESDSDEDPEGVYRELGMSPPKTIQFSLPQSRLLQTPAREASKRIVEDLLLTAGANLDDTDAADSPSVVAGNRGLDDSF